MVMASFSCPIMNFHDISFNEKVPLVFTRYDNNNTIGNVWIGWKGGELEILKVVDVKRQNATYIIEVHLKEFMNTKTSLETTLLNFIHLNILKGE